jgi:sacsin
LLIDVSCFGFEILFMENLTSTLSSPSFDTVTRRLTQLAGEIRSATTTSLAIATLKCAVLLALTETQLSQLLVPDDLHHLRPIQDVLFNDVGENSLLLSENEVCLANSSIDDALAQDLGLQRLGHKHVHLQTLGEDMGVTPATIVEKTLAQYTEKQFLPEFLANAEDAGASKLMVITNDYTPTEGNFLSPALRRLYDGHSVMVYNDSEFSDTDFEGICRTHIGGKANNPDSIGQFGLGALTMFHITEVSVGL